MSLSTRTDADRVQQMSTQYGDEPAGPLHWQRFLVVTVAITTGLVALWAILPLPDTLSWCWQYHQLFDHPFLAAAWFTYWFFIRLSAFEWWFHDAIMHRCAIPLLEVIGSKHKRHHGLTISTAIPSREAPDCSLELSTYVMGTKVQEQHRDFPLYSLAIFLAYGVVRFVLPLALVAWYFRFNHLSILAEIADTGILPFFLAMVCYHTLYELIHWAYHVPEANWEWSFRLPGIGAGCKRLYLEHEKHHDDLGSHFNLVVPFADWLFGTLHPRPQIRKHGRYIPKEERFHVTPNRLGAAYYAWEYHLSCLLLAPLAAVVGK
jgi:hypothetical protein